MLFFHLNYLIYLYVECVELVEYKKDVSDREIFISLLEIIYFCVCFLLELYF